MPRCARAIVPGVALHVIQRGNNRGICFFADGDRLAYLRYLHKFSLEAGCAVHAYCLMTNHVHMLLTPKAANACAVLMKSLGQHYVQYVNRVHDRTGTLWEGRYRSCLAESERYVLACYRYIELNPVRAGLVAHPRDYLWSSYRANAQGRKDSVLVPHAAFLGLGDDFQHSRHAYCDLIDSTLDPILVQEIRSATRNGHRLGVEPRARGRPTRK